MHPRFGVEKTYHVQVAGAPTRDDLDRLLKGVWLAEGHVKARRVRRLKEQGESTWLEIVLAEGKNREVRRMLARLGHKVLRLKRVGIGPVRLDRLKKGKARRLPPDELARLRRAASGRREPKEDGPRQAHAAGHREAASRPAPPPRPSPAGPRRRPRR
jgi:23S rRNA pseudouridine2605 synthase